MEPETVEALKALAQSNGGPIRVCAQGCSCTHAGIEASRIALLLARDGEEATREWVKRTYAIYRRAVLDPGHFASTGDYRRAFLASCREFRRWLREHRR